MRLRNLKNKEEIIKNSKYVVKNPEDYKGKWNELFNNNNPIHIEIGMGKGKFLKEHAKENPNINYVGIERLDNILARCVKEIDLEIPNLKIIRGNALDINLFFDSEIDRIYLNFSDPWPKKRHQSRRLTSKVFLEKYDKIFKNNNEIFLRTDNRDLFIYSIESLSQYGYSFSDVSFDLHEIGENIITTEYGDKFLSLGLQIYALKARK